MPNAAEIVQLKITLDNMKPTVLRRIEVSVGITLDLLHEIIQAIMPWGNYHAYGFRVRDARWGIPVPEGLDFGIESRDATQTTLAEALAESNFKALRYTYDFGDDWHHTIKVERRFSAELWEQFPRLIDAKGRCPPEDVGGPWGFAEYLEAMSNPRHERHAERMKWRGPFNPNVIDLDAIEQALTAFAKSTTAPSRSRKS